MAYNPTIEIWKPDGTLRRIVNDWAVFEGIIDRAGGCTSARLTVSAPYAAHVGAFEGDEVRAYRDTALPVWRGWVQDFSYSGESVTIECRGLVDFLQTSPVAEFSSNALGKKRPSIKQIVATLVRDHGHSRVGYDNAKISNSFRNIRVKKKKYNGKTPLFEIIDNLAIAYKAAWGVDEFGDFFFRSDSDNWREFTVGVDMPEPVFSKDNSQRINRVRVVGRKGNRGRYEYTVQESGAGNDTPIRHFNIVDGAVGNPSDARDIAKGFLDEFGQPREKYQCAVFDADFVPITDGRMVLLRDRNGALLGHKSKGAISSARISLTAGTTGYALNFDLASRDLPSENRLQANHRRILYDPPDFQPDEESFFYDTEIADFDFDREFQDYSKEGDAPPVIGDGPGEWPYPDLPPDAPPEKDTDDDGVSDKEEILDGTDPDDPNDQPPRRDIQYPEGVFFGTVRLKQGFNRYAVSIGPRYIGDCKPFEDVKIQVGQKVVGQIIRSKSGKVVERTIIPFSSGGLRLDAKIEDSDGADTGARLSDFFSVSLNNKLAAKLSGLVINTSLAPTRAATWGSFFDLSKSTEGKLALNIGGARMVTQNGILGRMSDLFTVVDIGGADGKQVVLLLSGRVGDTKNAGKLSNILAVTTDNKSGLAKDGRLVIDGTGTAKILGGKLDTFFSTKENGDKLAMIYNPLVQKDDKIKETEFKYDAGTDKFWPAGAFSRG